MLTLPGFLHDVCSAVHPLGVASLFFSDIALYVEWVHPDIPVSHPLGNGRAAGLFRDVKEGAAQFGSDKARYRRLIEPLTDRADEIVEGFLGPMGFPPRHPSSFTRLAARGALPATSVIGRFSSDEVRAVLAGLAAHAIAPLNSPVTFIASCTSDLCLFSPERN